MLLSTLFSLLCAERTTILQTTTLPMSGLIRYKKTQVEYQNESIEVEIIVGGTETLCSVAEVYTETGTPALFAGDDTLREYCMTLGSDPLLTLTHYSDVNWPVNFTKLISLDDFLLCVQEEILPNCNSTLRFQSDSRRRRSANLNHKKRVLTPELVYQALNSTECRYENFSVNCHLGSSKLRELFVPPVVVDTHLGPRNVTHLSNKTPINVYSPSIINYLDHPVFIINSNIKVVLYVPLLIILSL